MRVIQKPLSRRRVVTALALTALPVVLAGCDSHRHRRVSYYRPSTTGHAARREATHVRLPEVRRGQATHVQRRTQVRLPRREVRESHVSRRGERRTHVPGPRVPNVHSPRPSPRPRAPNVHSPRPRVPRGRTQHYIPGSRVPRPTPRSVHTPRPHSSGRLHTPRRSAPRKVQAPRPSTPRKIHVPRRSASRVVHSPRASASRTAARHQAPPRRAPRPSERPDRRRR
jgi:hypothetical protein